MRRRVLLYCDGGRVAEIGTGHVRRCLLLAGALKARGSEVSFLTASGAAVTIPVEAEGFRCEVLPSLRPAELARALKRTRPEIVVWDRLDSSPALNRAIKGSGAVLLTLDDAGAGQALADVTINAMVTGGRTPYKGFDYAMLPAPPEPARADRSAPVRRVVVCFGGYDHEGLSEAALRALVPLDRRIEIDLILGSASSSPSAKTVALHGARLRVLRTPPDFGRLLSRSDIAILAGGATLIEALNYGVPVLAIGQYGHQLDTIARCEAAGAAVGVASTESLLRAVRALAADAPRRVALSRAARMLVDGQGLKRVAELTTIVEPLPWDTNFFGMKIATLHTSRVNETIMDHALAKARAAKIDCLYYRCDCHDPVSVALAERHGFHFVDIRMTFQRRIEPRERVPRSARTIRPARRSDLAQLKKIAAGSYVYSRYFFDRRFPDAICAKFYANWIEKAVGGYSDVVLVAAEGRRVLGYISCSMRAGTKAAIDLVSVAPGAEGAGIGKTLVAASLDWAGARGAASMEVVTQGRNYAAQRLYQGNGFKTQKLELWYHKWFAK